MRQQKRWNPRGRARRLHWHGALVLWDSRSVPHVFSVYYVSSYKIRNKRRQLDGVSFCSAMFSRKKLDFSTGPLESSAIAQFSNKKIHIFKLWFYCTSRAKFYEKPCRVHTWVKLTHTEILFFRHQQSENWTIDWKKNLSGSQWPSVVTRVRKWKNLSQKKKTQHGIASGYSSVALLHFARGI